MSQEENAMQNQEAVRKQISLTMEEAKDYVNRFEALERLKENPDFKLLFEENYCKDFCCHLVSLLGDDAIFANPEQYAKINEQVKSIGWFKHYMRGIRGMGLDMKRQIQAAEEEEKLLDEEIAQGNA